MYGCGSNQFELLGCVAALIACFLLAIYCGSKADDIDERIHYPDL